MAIGLLVCSIKILSVSTAPPRGVLNGTQLVSVAIQVGAGCSFRIEEVGRNLCAKLAPTSTDIAQVAKPTSTKSA
jgi:hypothetical protein